MRSRLLLGPNARIGLLLGLIAACGGSTETSTGAVERRDSAGIVIIETPGSMARAPLGWTVGEEPELQLGSADGEESVAFHQINGRFLGGITGFPDGRIVVVNAGSGELLFFDGEGVLQSRVGIQGDGPGEFRRPVLVPYTSNDSLLIRDGNRRFTLFSGNGQVHRSFVSYRLGGLVGNVVGASKSGIVLTNSLIGPRMVEGQHVEPHVVRLVSVESGRIDTIAQVNTHKYAYFVEVEGGAPVGMAEPVLFTTGPSAAVGVDGVFVTGGDVPEVRAFDNSGRLVRVFRLKEAPRLVTDEDVDGAIASPSERTDITATVRSAVSRAYERMAIPRHWPTFQSVRVDRLGWIWGELYRPPHHLTPQWMVFDSTGVARGVIELPPGLEVHDIGSDYVLGRWLDDRRVEYVRRYQLDRGR